MKTLDDALRHWRRLLQALEMAELTDDPKQRAGWLTIAIVGAGPTGVEIAGQIRALARADPRHQLPADRSRARTGPADRRGARAAAASSAIDCRRSPARELGQLGVELRMGVRVTARSTPRALVLEGPAGHERIEARTVIWAAGVQASPLARMLADASGASCDRAGRIAVLPRLHAARIIPACSRSATWSASRGFRASPRWRCSRACTPPRRSAAAWPAGTTCRTSSTATSEAWRPSAGSARWSACTGFASAGCMGWLTWAFIHITFLTGFANRFSAMLHWMRTPFSAAAAASSPTARASRARRTRAERRRALASRADLAWRHCDQVPAPTSIFQVVLYVGSEILVPVNTSGWNT